MSVENLNNQEGIEKIKELVNHIDIAMMHTFPKDENYPYGTPMSRQEVDENGIIWFLVSIESQTAKNITQNNKVSLSFSHVSDYKFLKVDGIGELLVDQERIDKYWNKFVEVYFEKGKEDPSIRILKVTPDDVFYWDTKTNKIMTFLHVATAAITGQKIDIGKEGEINI